MTDIQTAWRRRIYFIRQGFDTTSYYLGQALRDTVAIGLCMLLMRHRVAPDIKGRIWQMTHDSDVQVHEWCSSCGWCRDCRERRLDLLADDEEVALP